ncbi:MAG TPA: DNA repair protein RecO [Thermoleophilia bacterium]|nr:DNA repair protein RecO [Thermoleophilia bacterium]
MRYENVRAVVLSSRPLGEADRIVTLFTKELGRVDAVVKGVRRTKSRWGGRLEPFGVVDLILFRGRTLFTVTSAQLARTNLRLHEDREAMAAAAVLSEASAGLFADAEPEERAFNLLSRALREIDAGFAGPALRAPLVLGGLVKLLSEAGYLPVLDQCAACGASDGLALAFSAARGGLVCERCLHEGVPITAEAVTALRQALGLPLAELRALPGDEGVEEAFRHLHALYAYHTGAQLRSLRFARAG